MSKRKRRSYGSPAAVHRKGAVDAAKRARVWAKHVRADTHCISAISSFQELAMAAGKVLAETRGYSGSKRKGVGAVGPRNAAQRVRMHELVDKAAQHVKRVCLKARLPGVMKTGH